MAKSLHVTQVKSVIKSGTKLERTMRALGITRMNQTVVHDDTHAIRMMVFKIKHLVKVEEV